MGRFRQSSSVTCDTVRGKKSFLILLYNLVLVILLMKFYDLVHRRKRKKLNKEVSFIKLNFINQSSHLPELTIRLKAV